MSLNCAILVLLLVCHGRMPGLAAGACTPATCLNGGTCDASGSKCNCPVEGRADYGPRCELGIRGYVSTSPRDPNPKYAVTKHDLSGFSFQPGSLTVTFEFVAHCHNPPFCPFFVIKGASSQPLLTVAVKPAETSPGATSVDYVQLWMPKTSVDHSNTNDAKTFSIPTAQISMLKSNWQSLSITIFEKEPRQFVGTAELCSMKTKYCIVIQPENSNFLNLQSVFANSIIWIGRFVGCIRDVRINGVLVDLGKVAGYEGPANTRLTYPFCPFFMYSCHKFARDTRTFNRNYCGKDSQCNGEVKRWFSGNQETCTCRCINGKRRQLETVSNSDKCTNLPLTTNECTTESPGLSLGSANCRVDWKMQNDGLINLHKNYMSLEAYLRTKRRNWEKAFELLSSDPVNKLPYIKLSGGLLHVIATKPGSPNSESYSFPKVLVSDGEWHYFRLDVWTSVFKTTLDTISLTHYTGMTFNFQAGASLVLSLPNSCVRAVRLSNIYMPTGGGDVTKDSSTTYIKVTMGSGVEVNGAVCTATVLKDVVEGEIATCSSSSSSHNGTNSTKDGGNSTNDGCNHCVGMYQQCRTDSGVPTCECIDGFARDLRGNCIMGIDQIRAIIPDSCDHVRPGVLIIAFAAACHLVQIHGTSWL